MEFSLVTGDRQAIGGSDWTDILRIAPYGCARRGFYRISGAMPDTEDASNKYMERGTRLQDIILDLYEDATNHKVSRETSESPLTFTGPQPYLKANLDGVVYIGDKPVINVECKTMGDNAFKDFIANGLPKQYEVQVQYQMWLSGCHTTHVAILWADGWEFEVEEVKADPAIHQQLEAVAAAFWDAVENGREPERLPERAYTCWECPFRVTCWSGVQVEPEPEPITLIDSESIGIVGEYQNIDNQVKFNQRRLKHYRKKLDNIIDVHGGEFMAGEYLVKVNVTKNGQKRLKIKKKGE